MRIESNGVHNLFQSPENGVVKSFDTIAFENVDVRSPKEWDGGHIPQAISMPLNHLAESALSLDRDARIAAICAGGYRSSIATSLLEQLGFRKISNIVGGMTAWNNAKPALPS
jgi:rhodanese-related sulfurtransferase